MKRMPGLLIRRATAADIEQLAPLFDAYRVFYGQPSDLDGARAFMLERLRLAQSVVFMAIGPASSEAVGFAQLYPSFSSVRMRPIWILYDLYVVDEARRTGIGRALMEHAHRFARDAGAHHVSLSTARDNIPGQRLYESLGYVRDEQFFHYDLAL